jgi:hypothetical protein
MTRGYPTGPKPSGVTNSGREVVNRRPFLIQ